MNRLDMDDRFYDKAMSFFIEAGHIATREPEYFNLSTDQITLNDDEYDEALLENFDNLSLLFVIRQCMFFSAELLTDRKHRSQIARDVHEMIHSLIEMNASVCVFRLEDEMLISFKGYGCQCVLSDWYPINDRNGLLAERLDISNVSTKSNYGYFRDLMYSLERDYYRIREEKTIHSIFPIDGIGKVSMGELSIAELTRLLHDSMEKDFLEYGDDYVPYRAAARASMPDITHELNIMLRVPTDAGENPFGEKVETDDNDDDDFFEDINPKEDGLRTAKRKQISQWQTGKDGAASYQKKQSDMIVSTNRERTWEAKRDPSDQTIEDEILLVLDVMERPIDFNDLKQRSPVLSDADSDILNSLLYKLCMFHKVYRVWIQAERRYFYCINTPEMRQETLRNSQKQIALQQAAKEAKRKKEKEEMLKMLGRSPKQSVTKQETEKKKTTKKRTGKSKRR